MYSIHVKQLLIFGKLDVKLLEETEHPKLTNETGECPTALNLATLNAYWLATLDSCVLFRGQR